MLDESWKHYIESLVKDKRYETILGEMLAIMNGDGGHYQDNHGTSQAVFNAIERWQKRGT